MSARGVYFSCSCPWLTSCCSRRVDGRRTRGPQQGTSPPRNDHIHSTWPNSRKISSSPTAPTATPGSGRSGAQNFATRFRPRRVAGPARNDGPGHDPLQSAAGPWVRRRGYRMRTDADGDAGVVPAEDLVRAGQAACSYSLRALPRRCVLRTFRWVVWTFGDRWRQWLQRAGVGDAW